MNRPLVADTPDLSLTPGGNANDTGVSLSLTLSNGVSQSPHANQSRTGSYGGTSNWLHGNIALNSNQSSLFTML